MSGGSGSTGRVSGTAAPRYAPEDPSLPKPWRGLVDGTTGYLYYWNPETNVTQYEKPLPPEEQLPPPPPPLPPPPPRGRDRERRDRSRTPPRRDHRDRDRDHRRHDEHNSSKSASSHHHPPLTAAPAVATNDPSTEAYCRRHEITVIGDNVPAPITAFESGGFPPEILKEMRYLLRGGANVVRCFTLPRPIYKCGGLRADVVDGAAKGGWTPKAARCPWRKGAPTSTDSLLCAQFLGKAPRMDGGPLLGPDYGGLAWAVNVQI